MEFPPKIYCAMVLTSLLLTGCGAPKPPLPYGDRIPVNGALESSVVNRSRLADEPMSMDPFEKPAVAPVVLQMTDPVPSQAPQVSEPVMLHAAPAEEENLSLSPDALNVKE